MGLPQNDCGRPISFCGLICWLSQGLQGGGNGTHLSREGFSREMPLVSATVSLETAALEELCLRTEVTILPHPPRSFLRFPYRGTHQSRRPRHTAGIRRTRHPLRGQRFGLGGVCKRYSLDGLDRWKVVMGRIVSARMELSNAKWARGADFFAGGGKINADLKCGL